MLEGLGFLTRADIVGEMLQEEIGTIGKPYFVMKTPEGRIGLIAEGKSTHNLLIPNKASVFVSKYKNANEKVIKNQQQERTIIEWGSIAHPFAQLLGYLVDNKRRYGALTSCTQTVFIFISGTGTDLKINVSEPYYIGETNYLRAWAYVYSLDYNQEDTFKLPRHGGKSWVRTSAQKPSTPQPSRESKPTGSTNRARQSKADERNQRAAKRGREVSCDLPQVDFDDLVVGEELGSGRNGSLFKVKWNGEAYACIETIRCWERWYREVRKRVESVHSSKEGVGKTGPETILSF